MPKTEDQLNKLKESRRRKIAIAGLKVFCEKGYESTTVDDIMKKADLNMDGFINQEDITLLDNYLVEYRISLVIASEGRKNIFPNEDMKVFVNMFNGDFMYDYAIRDDEGERH